MNPGPDQQNHNCPASAFLVHLRRPQWLPTAGSTAGCWQWL